MRFLPLLALLLVALFGARALRAGGVDRGEAPYHAKVEFHPRQALAFPDFSLVYTGQSNVPPPKGLHSWVVHEFTVTAGGHEQKITWSAGTGDIGPTLFKVGAKTFLLELSRSDTLGKLAENELVVRPAEAKR